MNYIIDGKVKGESDYDLIKKVQDSGDNDAYLELRERYEKVYYSMCHRYLKACAQIGVKEEDILENMDFVLLKCAQSFDFRRKLKFSTWVANQARYFCLNSMRRAKKVMDTMNTGYNTTDLDEETNHGLEKDIKREDNSFIETNFKYAADILSKIKDRRSIEILKLRYSGGRKSWQTIAAELSLPTSFCRKLHDRTINLLQLKFAAQNTCDII